MFNFFKTVVILVWIYKPDLSKKTTSTKLNSILSKPILKIFPISQEEMTDFQHWMTVSAGTWFLKEGIYRR